MNHFKHLAVAAAALLAIAAAPRIVVFEEARGDAQPGHEARLSRARAQQGQAGRSGRPPRTSERGRS